MKKVIRYFNLIMGCLLVALSFNFLMIPYNIISFGSLGVSSLIYYINEVHPAINILIINLIVLTICSIFTKKEIIKMYLLPSIIIPTLILITSPLVNYFEIIMPEMMLTVLACSALSGYGYGLIYKQGYSAGVIFLIEELIGKLTRFHSKLYSWVIDIIILLFSLIIFEYQTILYSLVAMFITKYIITKARFGINDSKMFYVITTKEKEVKNYIMHDLKYELTVLDVKGGFTKKQNKILLSVISSSDYYRLKEGIKIIDPKAFIAITDTYDVVNIKSF